MRRRDQGGGRQETGGGVVLPPSFPLEPLKAIVCHCPSHIFMKTTAFQLYFVSQPDQAKRKHRLIAWEISVAWRPENGEAIEM